jgi:hypothetical protein
VRVWGGGRRGRVALVSICVLATLACTRGPGWWPRRPVSTSGPPGSRPTVSSTGHLGTTTFRTTTWRPPPTSATTTTTWPHCSGAAGHCPRDITAALTGAGVRRVDALEIADTGEIVGYGQSIYQDTNLGGTRGFRIPPGGPARLLAGPRDTPTDNSLVIVWGISPHTGWVVGAVTDNGVAPAVWDRDDRLTELGAKLPTFGGRLSSADAWSVNDAGQVFGRYQLELPPDPATGITLAVLLFVWDSRTDRVTVLNPEAVSPPTMNKPTRAEAINDRGVMVGMLSGRVVRWWPQPDGGYRREDLGPGVPSGIDSAGDVVANAAGGAVLWPATASAPVPLPGRRNASPTDGAPTASDINGAGVIVGGLRTEAGMIPVRWPAGATEPAETLDPDWGSAQADAINDTGTIVGRGDRGDWRVLVWDP